MLSDYSVITVRDDHFLIRMCLSGAVHGVAPKNIRINIKDSEGRLLINSREIWMYAVRPH